MFRTRMLHLKRLHGLDSWTPSELLEKFSVRFDQNDSFGFIDTQLKEKIISSTLIYKTLARQRVFSPTHNTLSSRRQEVYHYIPFQVDLEDGLLEAGLGGTKLSKLVSILGILFNFRLTISDIAFDIHRFIQRLDDNNLDYKVLNVSVANFSPETGLSGRYIASIFEQEAARQFIQRQNSNIRRIDVEMALEGAEMIWRLSSSGWVSVRTDEEMLDESKALFKEVFLRQ
jgi:hypothetical protein